MCSLYLDRENVKLILLMYYFKITNFDTLCLAWLVIPPHFTALYAPSSGTTSSLMSKHAELYKKKSRLEFISKVWLITKAELAYKEKHPPQFRAEVKNV
jgi:hypothetical protein